MKHSEAETSWEVVLLEAGSRHSFDDTLSVEEPLELAVVIGAGPVTSAFTTLRTPGHDHDLALGWLLSEGVIAHPGVVEGIERQHDPSRPLHQQVVARLRAAEDLTPLNRLGWASSACGVCGRTAIAEVLELTRLPPVADVVVASEVLFSLPKRLRAGQVLFERTGAIHAAGLFDPAGDLLSIAEDVGRHNAVDKVIGAAARRDLEATVLVVSGRAGFEIVAKAARRGIAVVAAVGAPSDLAVRVAHASGLTLVGFLREGRANLYTHPNRVSG